MFGVPWIVFGVQHYMYADFVRTLMPAYMPWRLFWAYFTGTAMLVAGLSFVARWQVRPAAFLLGCLMLLYLLIVHPPILWREPEVGQHWTRFMQDIAIMSASFGLAMVWGAGRARAVGLVRYGYALPFVLLGIQHFTHNRFLTAKLPDWAPFSHFWDYIIGAALIAAAYGMLFTSAKRRSARALGTMLTVLALLRHLPPLVTDIHNPGVWTGSMLDFALAAGAFIVAWTGESI
jgi:uncharacterized membrane protein